jgi:hypothetical protein
LIVFLGKYTGISARTITPAIVRQMQAANERLIIGAAIAIPVVLNIFSLNNREFQNMTYPALSRGE